MFLVSAWEKINAEAIKILRNPKKNASPRIKNIFVRKRKAICHFIKKLFCLSQDFQT